MNKLNQRMLTAEEIEIRIWAVMCLIVGLTFMFIVVSLIYRTTFVVQPIKAISPMDQADQKMLNDIVLLIVGSISGILARKGVKALSEAIASSAASTAVSKPFVTNVPLAPRTPVKPLSTPIKSDDDDDEPVFRGAKE